MAIRNQMGIIVNAGRLRMIEELSRIDIVMYSSIGSVLDACCSVAIRSPIINCLTRAKINRRKND